MGLIIVVLGIFLLFGGGGFYGYRTYGHVGGIVPVILLVFVLLWLFGGGGIGYLGRY